MSEDQSLPSTPTASADSDQPVGDAAVPPRFVPERRHRGDIAIQSGRSMTIGISVTTVRNPVYYVVDEQKPALRFPVTGKGWAQAWQVFAAGDPDAAADYFQRATTVPIGIPTAMVTTLPTLPGYQVTKVHGIVSELTSASGWTAASKGNTALNRAIDDVRASASALSANAVVGLAATAFGAHGGITNIVGGDAVGVLLLGTAVSVEPLDATADSAAGNVTGDVGTVT